MPRDKGPRRVAESTIEFNRKNIVKMGADTIRIKRDSAVTYIYSFMIPYR